MGIVLLRAFGCVISLEPAKKVCAGAAVQQLGSSAPSLCRRSTGVRSEALYRRGLAAMGLGHWASAKADLLAAAKKELRPEGFGSNALCARADALLAR